MRALPAPLRARLDTLQAPRGRVALSTLCTALALALVAPGWRSVFAAALWLGSLILAMSAFPRRRREEGGDCCPAAPALLVVALCAGLSLFRVTEIPPGLWIDELVAATNSITLSEQRPFEPFGSSPMFEDAPEWVHIPNLYLYYCYVVLWLSGFSQLGVKLISVLPGVAAPLLLYWLARKVLDRLPAFTAAALLAVSHWHITLNRWGWNEVMSTALAVLMFSLLLDATRREDGRAAFLAGVVAGLSLYAYVSSRLMVLAALALLVIQAVQHRTRAMLRNLLVFAWAVLLATAPHLLHWLGEPVAFNARVSELSILPSLAQGDWGPLLTNLKVYPLMLHLAGDRNGRQNIPGQPMLDVVTGTLFLLGLALALGRWRRPEAQMVLVWLGSGMLGGILTNPETAPHGYRTGVVIPACMLLAGMGFAWIGGLRPMRRRFAAEAVACVVLATSATVTATSYFVERPRNRVCWDDVFEGALTETVRANLQKLTAAGTEVLVDTSLSWMTSRPQLNILTRRHSPTARWAWTDLRALTPRDLSGRVLLVAPGAWARQPAEMRALPSRLFLGPFGDEILLATSADRGLLGPLGAGQRSDLHAGVEQQPPDTVQQRDRDGG
ncbi:MAG: glycosyltransferase family 39 protein [Thermoanaerobaculaceae bacterium]|nr:glycosyltransferase family 39 protein [Thermoanaerobaculaceae bacterium]